MVNAQIPVKQVMSQSEINEKILLSAQTVSEYIKNKILNAAKKWDNQDNFSYYGLLAFKDLNSWVKHEKFTFGIVDSGQSTTSSGFLFKTEIHTDVYISRGPFQYSKPIEIKSNYDGRTLRSKYWNYSKDSLYTGYPQECLGFSVSYSNG